MSDGRRIAISLIVPGMVNREDVADGAMPGVSPQRPIRAPKPGCEGQGLTNDNQPGKQNANLHQRIYAAHGAADWIQLDAASSTAQGLAEGAPQEGTLQAEPGNQGEVGRRIAISLIVPGTVNREDVADGAVPGVSPQRPIHAPKPGCEGQGLTNGRRLQTTL